jgi:DNA-binding PadR family transcriptional regulator
MLTQSLPGGQVDLLLLAVVATGPINGYAIIDKLRQKSDDVFDLPEGTIYPALYRLERLGLITSSTQIVDSRRRRVYELTKVGRAAMAERKQSWKRLAAGMAAVLART